MTTIHETLGEIIPPMYRRIAEQFKYPPHANPAMSNQCHVLTAALHEILRTNGIESRREYHQLPDQRIWHFVIAHTFQDDMPTEADTITDLNPWQFMEHPPADYTYLHGTREEVMDRLQDEGAPDYFVALRGLATVAHAHTDMPRPRLPY